MKVFTSFPDYLSEQERQSVRGLFLEWEILPISCRFWEADEARVIGNNRTIADDLIYILMSGSLDCTVGDEACTIGPGEFMMVPAGQRHGARMSSGFDTWTTFALHMHALDRKGNRVLERMRSPFGALPDPERWYGQLATCAHLMVRSDEAATAYFKQLVTWILHEQIASGNSLEDLPAKADPRIFTLLTKIGAHYDWDWSATAMAEECNLSVSRFRQIFKKSIGLSPKKYLRRVRMSLARSLLATEPTLSVQEVATRVGIADAHYFHAVYKETFGETPKEGRIGST